MGEERVLIKVCEHPFKFSMLLTTLHRTCFLLFQSVSGRKWFIWSMNLSCLKLFYYEVTKQNWKSLASHWQYSPHIFLRWFRRANSEVILYMQKINAWKLIGDKLEFRHFYAGKLSWRNYYQNKKVNETIIK